MHDYDEDNDGRFPDESPVEVRYPRSKQEERSRKSRVTLSGWILAEHPDLTPADIHESLLYAAEALQERELPLWRTV